MALEKRHNYKKAYFSLRDEIAKSTGYTRIELHSLSKRHILPLLLDEEDCWIDSDVDENIKKESTHNLTDKGWELFYEQFKSLIYEII